MTTASNPERYSPEQWLNSQLSIARHTGGCRINGTDYFVDPRTNDLVRADVFAKEAKARRPKSRPITTKSTKAMIEASEARKLSGSYQSEKAGIEDAEKRIQDAALSGKFSTQVGSLTPFAISYLKQHDYRIIPHDHPDGGSTYTITWEIESQYR